MGVCLNEYHQVLYHDQNSIEVNCLVPPQRPRILINPDILTKLMTRKLMLGAIVAVVFSLGVLGTLNPGTDTDNVKTSNADVSQNYATSMMAFAEKPVKEIILINVNPDYGSTSSFVIDDVTCQTSTKDGETKVNWCKATAIMDKTEFEFLRWWIFKH